MTAAHPNGPCRADSHLITPRQVRDAQDAAARDEGKPVRLLDVRWRLDRPEGRPEYLRAHLPGAVYVDLDHELAHREQPNQGRHPLPPLKELQVAARGWGLNDGDLIVAYDDIRSVAAARLWWLLRRAGVSVRVLDGGLRGWVAAGYDLESGDVRPTGGSITLQPAVSGALTIDETQAFPDRGVLLDVRSPEHYRGDRSPLDPVGGHIPGAVNLPTMAHVVEDGTLHHPDVLRRIFLGAGVTAETPVGVYCGSGIAATHTALALAEAGIDAQVFPGSWSQWSNTRGRLVAVGILPRGRLEAV